MKKTAIAAVLILAVSAMAFGCGDPKTPGRDERLIEVEGLAETYYPNLERLDAENAEEVLAGKVDVDLIFGTTLDGWKAVADAYSRLQPGVSVELHDHSDSTYNESVTNAARDDSTDWDIFHGNRLGTRLNAVGYNFTSTLQSDNHYAGLSDDPDLDPGTSRTWQEVLERDAYITDKSGSNTACYTLNSESLSTAWFVNQTAFADAVKQGYLNADGKPETPKTWEDLINLCACMVKAGYTHPLGLSGNEASVNASQFAWLFRIYGDQYYRDMYPAINVQEGDKTWTDTSYEFKFDLNATQPETDRGYNPSHTRFWNSVLDENETYGAAKNIPYVGAKSDKFACMLENFYRLKPYLPVDFATVDFATLEDRFASNSSKSAPMILLDYTGYGLSFGLQERNFEIDFFDYPAMTCEHEENHVTATLVRDVGGNGGYLSAINHKDEMQNKINVDFVKFFMSPYGQSVYYSALKTAHQAPSGLSTVLNVAVPEDWQTFYESDKIEFNGLCDVNWYNNLFIYHVNGLDTTISEHLTAVQNLYKADGAEAVAAFQTRWDAAVREGYSKLCETMKWSKDIWMKPGDKVSA